VACHSIALSSFPPANEGTYLICHLFRKAPYAQASRKFVLSTLHLHACSQQEAILALMKERRTMSRSIISFVKAMELLARFCLKFDNCYVPKGRIVCARSTVDRIRGSRMALHGWPCSVILGTRHWFSSRGSPTLIPSASLVIALARAIIASSFVA